MCDTVIKTKQKPAKSILDALKAAENFKVLGKQYYINLSVLLFIIYFNIT